MPSGSSASPLNDSTYDPATGTFYLYYRYQLATESGNTWHEYARR